MRLAGFVFVSLVVAACGGTSVADDQATDASSDGKVDSKGPCDGLGCAIGPGKLTLHVLDSQFMQPIASPTFTENSKALQATCTMGDSGACATWTFDQLFIGPHTIVVHAINTIDATLMVMITGPAGCCGLGPDVDKTVVMSVLSPSSLCTSTGGTAGMNLCCASSNDFPDTCLIGACACSPQNSKMIQVCNCPQGKCYKPNVGCM